MRLYSRPGNDLTDRFPLEALARLRSRSGIIDGEARWCSAMPASSDSKASCPNARAPYRSGRSPDWLKIKSPDGQRRSARQKGTRTIADHRLAEVAGSPRLLRFGAHLIRLQAYNGRREMRMDWTTPTLVEICIGLEINGYLPAEF